MIPERWQGWPPARERYAWALSWTGLAVASGRAVVELAANPALRHQREHGLVRKVADPEGVVLPKGRAVEEERIVQIPLPRDHLRLKRSPLGQGPCCNDGPPGPQPPSTDIQVGIREGQLVTAGTTSRARRTRSSRLLRASRPQRECCRSHSRAPPAAGQRGSRRRTACTRTRCQDLTQCPSEGHLEGARPGGRARGHRSSRPNPRATEGASELAVPLSAPTERRCCPNRPGCRFVSADRGVRTLPGGCP